MKASARTLTLYRNFRGWLALVLAALLLGFFLLNHALKPRQVARLLLDRAGASLGLEITASGQAGYQLVGTPALVLRDLVAREPGGATPLLRVKRLYISLPWSTIRARGAGLAATRMELDSPVLDLPALRHWLATRPPTENRLPTLSQGLRIRDGSIVGDGWRIDRVQVDLPELAAERTLHARVSGRYLDASSTRDPLAIPVDLTITVMRPGALVRSRATGFAAAGSIAFERAGDWQLPATVLLSGPLSFGDGGLGIAPARLGAAGRYVSGDTALPFALGISGPLHFGGATWTLAPAGIALHGRGADPARDPVPRLDAHGGLAFGQRLSLRLSGILATWPQAWPALPQPLSASTSPLPFALRYSGTPDLSQVAVLRLQRDATTFDGRFRLLDVTGWVAGDASAGAPLPPLDGRLATPRLDISGTRLEGVQVILDDPDVPDAGD